MKSLVTALACVIVASIIVLGGTLAWAASLVTTDPEAVATFQTGALVLCFDALPSHSGGAGAGNTGIPIQSEYQLMDQFSNSGIKFSSTGGPLAVVSVEGLSNAGDAKSPFNVIGGSLPAIPLPMISYYEPIMLDFFLPDTTIPAVTSRVGAWNDPTGSRILLSVYDINGLLLESVEADEGFFIGITNPAIGSATFSFVSTQSVEGFSLDDVTFGAPVPAPATVWLFGSGLIGFLGFRRKLRK
jgi:PEP-CTERM motif